MTERLTLAPEDRCVPLGGGRARPRTARGLFTHSTTCQHRSVGHFNPESKFSWELERVILVGGFGGRVVLGRPGLTQSKVSASLGGAVEVFRGNPQPHSSVTQAQPLPDCRRVTASRWCLAGWGTEPL